MLLFGARSTSPLFFALTIVFCCLVGSVRGSSSGKEPCRTFRSHGLFTADCGGLGLNAIPTHLHNSRIEVLFMSVNRIRILKNDSFTDMDSLKLLFLHDNSIATIETAAFYPLDSLEILDLSLNSITKFSADIYLPSPLRKINISENPLEEFNLGEAVYLKEIQLTHCSYLRSFPHLGQLPNLQTLNFTNSLDVRSVNVSDLGGLCNLNELILPQNIFEAGNTWAYSCQCLYVTSWIYNHSIIYRPLRNCSISPAEAGKCPKEPMLEAEAVFAGCQNKYENLASSHWILLICAIVGVILCVLFLGILWRRRCRSKKRHNHTNSSNSTSSSRLKSSCDTEVASNERKLINNSLQSSSTSVADKNSRF